VSAEPQPAAIDPRQQGADQPPVQASPSRRAAPTPNTRFSCLRGLDRVSAALRVRPDQTAGRPAGRETQVNVAEGYSMTI